MNLGDGRVWRMHERMGRDTGMSWGGHDGVKDGEAARLTRRSGGEQGEGQGERR